jgi:hypothetical protein
MYIYSFLLRMTDTVTSQNIELSSWNTLYNVETDAKVMNGEWIMVTEGDGHDLFQDTVPIFAETD